MVWGDWRTEKQTKTAQANYEAPYSVATIGLSKNTISTQVTEKNAKITINVTKDEANNQIGWVDRVVDLAKYDDEKEIIKVALQEIKKRLKKN